MALRGEHEDDKQAERYAGRLSAAFGLVAIVSLGALLLGIQIGTRSARQTQISNQSGQTDGAPSKEHAPSWWDEFWDIRASDTAVAAFTGALVIVGWVQARRLREAIKTQTRDMGEYVAESKRAATAMEGVSNHLGEQVVATTQMFADQRAFWQSQMRAYLGIITGASVPQDNNTNWKWEVRMFVRNNGHTPARAVVVTSRLKILPSPLPADVDLTLPVERQEAAGNIDPGQAFFFRAWLDDLIDAETIEIITKGNTPKLYIYGTVYYRDIFGTEHCTNFCQFCAWDVKENFSTINVPRHNDAT